MGYTHWCRLTDCSVSGIWLLWIEGDHVPAVRVRLQLFVDRQEPRDHKWPTTGSGCWTQTLYYITCTNVTVNSSYPLTPFLKHKSPFYKTEPEVVRDERCWLNYHIMTIIFFFFFLSSCSIGLGFAVKSFLVLVSIASFKKFNLFSVIENSQ